MRHTNLTKQRIGERIAEAHRRLRQQRGGYLTAEAKTAVRAKWTAYYTMDRRRRHADRQRPALEAAHQANVAAADRFARRFLPMLLEMQKNRMGLREIAAEMNLRGYVTRQGRRWTDQAVRQMVQRKHKLIATEVLTQRRYVGWHRRI